MEQFNRAADFYAGKNDPRYANLVGGLRLVAGEADKLGEHQLPTDQITSGFAALNRAILRPTERLVLPSPDQLVAYAREGVIRRFGRDFEIPNPPEDLYEDVDRFSALGIRKIRISYQPTFQFDPQAELDPSHEPTLPIWQEGRGVNLESRYWEWMRDGRLSVEPWRAGWVVSMGGTKPPYDDGMQHYEDDAFMEQDIMIALRNRTGAEGLGKNEYGPDYSRAGVSPVDIEEKIIPYFVKVTGAKGIIEMPTALEANIELNDEDPRSGETNTSEWRADKLLIGKMVNGKFVEDKSGQPDRLDAGNSDYGGLADVFDWRSGLRRDYTAFRLRGRYSSQAA